MANNKKRAGGFKNNKLKTSKFLPGVFQTNLNSKWLDSTLDQMVSKGNLKDLNSYIGSQDGRYSTALDTYDVDNSYAPGMVTRNKDGSIKHTLTFDDVKTKVLTEFNEYNFGSAYASTSYYLRPPIDVDKFVNYTNYYWVEELPTYVSVNETVTDMNPVTDAQGRLNYTLTDDNESFALEDNMIIFFKGANWHADVKDRTYIVTGVGESINLRLYRDRYSPVEPGQGRQVYNFYGPASIRENDFWDQSELIDVAPVGTTGTHPITLLDNYIANPTTPLFGEWTFTDEQANPTLYVSGKLVKFSNAWDWETILDSNYTEAQALAEMSKIYLTQIDRLGNHTYKLIIDAEVQSNSVRTFPATGLVEQDNEWLYKLYGWNSSQYDASHSDVILKDYHVINRNCFYQTAWSRTNYWVNKQTILNLYNKTGMYFDKKALINEARVARRPILEFNSNMQLFSHVSQRTDNDQQLGHVDFLLPLDAKFTPKEDATGLYYDEELVPNDNTLTFNVDSTSDIKYRKLFTVDYDSATQLYRLVENKSLEVDDIANVRNAPNLDVGYLDSDLYYNGSRWIVGQIKETINQPPLFQLYDSNNVKLQDLPKSDFEGSKVFGYKLGTGSKDTELTFAVSYQDGPKGAEFIFENYLDTEVFQSVYRSNFSKNITNRRMLNNIVYFKVDNILKFNYEKSKIPHGAKNSYRFVADTSAQDYTIPYGYNNWRTTKDYYIHEYYGEAVVSELVSPGIVTDKSQSNNVHLLASPNTNINIYDLIPNNTITLRTHEGHDIENLPVGYAFPDVTVTRLDNKINLSFGEDTDGLQIYVDYSRTEFINKPYIIITDNADKIYYELTVNGKVLDKDAHTVNADEITVLANSVNANDIIVLEFINNKTSTTNGIPQVLEYNSNNKMVDTFTFTETLDHWHSLLRHIPDFQGDVMGENNYSASSKLLGAGGGTIFVHEDLSNTHDISFVDKSLNITGALHEQGRDWDSFRTRFINQIRRLYSTKSYESTYELTNDAIDLLVINRKGSELYKNSNMAYSHTSLQQKLFLVDGETDYLINFTANKDYLIQDQVYVYLVDDYKLEDRLIKRMLTKDVDYTITGNKITLLKSVTHTVGLDPYIDIVYHDMDSDSYIPPSSVKLGLQMGYIPNKQTGKIVCHDGYVYTISDTSSVEDMIDSPNFDPVAACLLDLETRVYSGLVQNTNYKNVYDYLPAPHRSTWYDKSAIDNHLEKTFKQWYVKTNQTTLTPENYFGDGSDSFKWNYSSVVNALPGYTNLEQLPGHYIGAYTYIFGTSTPHTTPWHMLGYSFKPSWWDVTYSWLVVNGDTTKRDALINALKHGYVNQQATNLTYARFNWDWTTSCPVDTNGALVEPYFILGSPSEANRVQPFVFGDWGPVEQEWRSTNQGYMALVDTIVKLSPAKAWTDFLQPGSLTENESRNARISERTKLFMSPADYRIPGVVYDNTVKGITFNNTIDAFKISDTFIKLYGIEDTPVLDTSINYTQEGSYFDGGVHQFVSSVSLERRGNGFKVQPTIVSNIPAQAENNTEIEVLLTKVPHTSNGILQAQYNFILRNQYDVDLEQIYKSLDTHLIYKVAGYTGKNLLNIKADSSILGPIQLTDQDYEIKLHKGLASIIPSASKLMITKTNVFYQVDGISNNRQEFLFYEPDLSNHALSKTLKYKDLSYRQYEKFANNFSVAEFGTKFSKIQDTYNFIRGYWEYMNVNGYTLETERDAVALDFIKWTTTANEGDVLHLEIGSNITFSPTQGTVQEYNTYGYHNNDILNPDSNIYEIKELGITRQDGVVLIETKDKTKIGGLSSAVINYEHAIVFNNKTSMGVKLYDGVKGYYQRRLLLTGQKTTGWDGSISAPGYLIKDDHIVQNFDSSVESTNDFYRTDVNEFNDQITKAKDITIGNIGRDWADSLGLNSTTVTNFYKGAIKNCGTTNALNRLSRTTILNHGNTTVNGYEQFMFRHSYMGDTSQLDSTEVVLNSKDIKFNPQVIVFGTTTDTDVISIPSDSSKMVNQGNTSFETSTIADSELDIFTAGEVLEDEAKYTLDNVTTIGNVYDSNEDYAKYETWNNATSYKRGTIVRYEGGLFECSVDSTGLNAITQGITRTGSNSEPRFPQGTQAVIDGITTTLTGITTTFNNAIDEIGSQDVTNIASGLVLSIDGEPITFSAFGDVPTWFGPGEAEGSSTNPALSDVTNKNITLRLNNGQKIVTIDFDTTPADIIETDVGVDSAPGNIIENFTGVDNGVAPLVDLQDTFTIAQALTTGGYSVDNVKVNGVVVINYNIVGQDIVFNSGSEPQDGESIAVTLSHAPILKTTFNISTPVTGDLFFNQVIVNGVLQPTSAYTFASQVVTFNSGPAANANIQFVISTTPYSMTAEEVKDKIADTLNSEQITTVICTRTNTGTLKFTLNDANNLDATLSLDADSGAGTNSLLGFQPSGFSLTQDIRDVQGPVPLDLSGIVSQINSNSRIAPVVASADGNKLRLQSTNATLTLSGTALSSFGLPAFTQATTSTRIDPDTEATAASQIQANLIANNRSDISVSVDASRIKISAPNAETLDLGDTSFNTIAGLLTGQQSAATDGAPNVFDGNQWSNISYKDPALFNIWVSDDSAYEVTGIQNVQTKFNSWNIFQVQNQNRLYTNNIEAGNDTEDGNDAKITTNVSHTLRVGDFVMLLNTTTVPNIDGIHKVTQVNPNNTTEFYIDRFIETDGTSVSILPLRTQRFETITQRNDAIASNEWNIPPMTLGWTNTDEQAVRSTNVYRTTNFVNSNPITPDNFLTNDWKPTSANANTFWNLVRDQDSRVTNADIKNALVYNTKDDQLYTELEVFDPLRGIIPGVADRELDFKNAFDPAIYNNSSDINYSIDTNDCWSTELVGKRWWDTGKAKYYDYDQGQRRDINGNIYYDYNYMSQHWGKLYPGSDIDVWEWTKSTVPPDDYADAVTGETVMYGQVATGTAYSLVNQITNENLYYYTQDQEWNATLGRYVDVYYFWVKDKETISSPDKFLTLQSLKSIMIDPTANGIGWVAAINNNSIIVSNANYFTDDESTILQINKANQDQSHNSWMLISEEKDIIPDYWYIGMRNNYSQLDSSYSRLPADALHPLNRIGDDRSKKQVWFSNIEAARYSGALTINDLLKSVNIWDEKEKDWTKIINDVDKDPIRQVPFGDIVWKWADYYNENYIEELSPSLILDTKIKLPDVDTDKHTYVKVQITNDDQIDRSEYYRYISNEWTLVRKDNSTVELNADYLSERLGWDMTGWDSRSWDNTKIQDHWITIVNGLRNYLFTGKYLEKFNQFFFATVRFAFATETKVDWVHKSTYIKLLVDQFVEQSTRVYKKNSINTIKGYVNTVKPFHTKISNIIDCYKTPQEEAVMSITEEHKANIVLKYENSDPIFQGTTYTNSATDPEFVYDGGSFDQDDNQYAEIMHMGNFLQPENYNQNQLTGIDVRPQELLNITVQTNEDTNTYAATTRTFMLVRDNNGYTTTYSITNSNTTDTVTELTASGLTVDVTDATNFEEIGFAVIGTELVRYIKDGNTLAITQRGINGTFVSNHEAGSRISDVSDKNYYVENSKSSSLLFNEVGKSILGSDKSLHGELIIDSGQGLEI